jgi:UrcA family protein
MSRIFTLALAVIALTGWAVLPASADSSTKKTIAVYYGDLDLSKESGQATLNARLAGAANAVCGRPGDDIRVLGQRAARKRCVEEALQEAYTSLNTNGVYAEVAE